MEARNYVPRSSLVEELVSEEGFADTKPPRASFGTADTDREQASKTAFGAYNYALEVDRAFHQVTWQAVQGSVYEEPYRRQFMGARSTTTRQPGSTDTAHARLDRFGKLKQLWQNLAA